MRLLPSTLLVAALWACSNTSVEAPSLRRPASIPAAIGELTENPEQVTLYALDPESVYRKGLLPGSDRALPAEQVFHDYPILSSAELPGAGERHQLVALLWEGISEPGLPVDCFNPRHGIRVQAGDRTLDWVLCFQCSALQVHDQDGELVAARRLGASVEPAFSALYRAVGLELAD